MAAKCMLVMLSVGSLMVISFAARLKAKAGSSAKAGLCHWGNEHCCCDVADTDVSSVQCKKFVTGMYDGEEACKCGDAIVKKKLGMKGHAPASWKKSAYVYYPLLAAKAAAGGVDIQTFYDKMDSMCAPQSSYRGGGGGEGVPIEFGVKGDAGVCTDARLFDLAGTLQGEEKITCLRQLRNSTSRHRDKLESSKLLKSFNDKIEVSALMGCAKIQQACDQSSLTSKAMGYAINNIENVVVGSVLKGQVMKSAQKMLVLESGISEETAKELLDWAFYHEEGTNPYCDAKKMEDRRDMLVRGLTAAEENHVVKKEAWEYGDEVYGPIRELVRGTIDGMFTADCPKKVDKQVDGVDVILTEEKRAELEAKEQAAVEARNYKLADSIAQNIDALSVGNPLLKFAEVSPMIKTTLQYMEKPLLNHPIEENEADFVRVCLKTLAKLLENENFIGQLKRFGEFDNWEMPAELDGLWKKTRNAKYRERIWPDELVEEFRNGSSVNLGCDCNDISPALGMHFLNMLPKIGLDFGKVTKLPNGKLVSDKETDTLEHVDLTEFANTMTMVEAGIADPVFAVKYITKIVLAAGEQSGSDSGLPDVSASGKIKGVLVGMPIIQNLWSALEDNASPEVFAKKMKWFFVANIAWAVWHAIETPLPPEDVVLGLLTLAYSTLSNFEYDGKWIVFSNSKEFTDQMLAVYTVWNYRFVKQWASNGRAQDQWMHVSVALSMPIIESLVNHGDVRHYINYRRDDLFHSMLLMLKQQ